MKPPVLEHKKCKTGFWRPGREIGIFGALVEALGSEKHVEVASNFWLVEVLQQRVSEPDDVSVLEEHVITQHNRIVYTWDSAGCIGEGLSFSRHDSRD